VTRGGQLAPRLEDEYRRRIRQRVQRQRPGQLRGGSNAIDARRQRQSPQVPPGQHTPSRLVRRGQVSRRQVHLRLQCHGLRTPVCAVPGEIPILPLTTEPTILVTVDPAKIASALAVRKSTKTPARGHSSNAIAQTEKIRIGLSSR
jgi:hypothetical protein